MLYRQRKEYLFAGLHRHVNSNQCASTFQQITCQSVVVVLLHPLFITRIGLIYLNHLPHAAECERMNECCAAVKRVGNTIDNDFSNSIIYNTI